MRKNFDAKVNLDGIIGCVAIFELLAKLFRHFHVLEHDLKSLRELASTLLLEFQNEGSFCILANLTLLEQPLGEAADVEAFKDILIEQVTEDRDNFVKSLCELSLLNVLEVLFEHLIKVEDESLCRPVVDIDDLFKCHFDGQINLRVLLHGFGLDAADSLSQLDELDDQLVILGLFRHEFVALIDDELTKVLPEQLKRVWSALQHVVGKT